MKLVYILLCLMVASCDRFLKTTHSQCDDDFIRQNVGTQLKTEIQGVMMAQNIDIKMGQSSTIKSQDGEYQCNVDIVATITKASYKAKSSAELSKLAPVITQ